MKKIAFYLFLATLIFSPLAFGTVERWSYTIMELMICVSAIFLFLSRTQASFYKVPGLIPLLVFSSLVLFQCIPLPAALVRLISLESHAIYQNTVGTMTSVDWMPISIFPRATLMEFFRFSSYILFYVTAVQLLSDRLLLKKTMITVVWFGALMAFFVIIEFITRSLDYPISHDKILWIRQSIQGSRSVGPYVNANHYAGLMEMIFPLALSLFLVYQPVMSKKGLRETLSILFLPKNIGRHYLYGLAAVLIAASIFVSLSRGGIVSLIVSVCFIAIFLIRKKGRMKTGGFVGIIFVVAMLLIGPDVWNLIFGEFDSVSSDVSLRFSLWADCIKIISDFPLLGSGMGTFENIYPKYRTSLGNDILEFAHNDYIGFLCTGGFIMVSVMCFCFFAILFKSFKTYQKRHERYSIYLFIGCLVAIVAILLHSFVDFNMQIGANGLYFFFILALIVSSAHTRLRQGRQASLLKISRINPYIPVVVASLICIGGVYTNFGALIANYQMSDYEKIALSSDFSEAERKQICKISNNAAMFDFLNPRYPYAAATAGIQLNQPVTTLNDYLNSIKREPLNSRYLQEAGYFLSLQGENESADKLMETAISNDSRNMEAYLTYAVWLIEQNRVENALGVLKSAILIEPKIINASIELMDFFMLDEQQMSSALPDRVEPHQVLAEHYFSQGLNQEAERSYVIALKYIFNENNIQKVYFTRVYKFYNYCRDYDNALHIIQMAMKHFPDDEKLIRTAKSLDRKVGGKRDRAKNSDKIDLLGSQ